MARVATAAPPPPTATVHAVSEFPTTVPDTPGAAAADAELESARRKTGITSTQPLDLRNSFICSSNVAPAFLNSCATATLFPESFIKDKPKFKYIIPNESIGSLKGKTNALANAIKISCGEIILTTDADCIVSPEWVKTHASYYSDNVGFVGGFTTQQDQNSFAGMQAIDFVYLLTVAAGSLNFGKPLSCIGNNMSYRKSVYKKIGGYEGLHFSVTEDFNLLMAIHDLKEYKIIYPLDVGALVTSKACPDWKTLYWQKKRWGVGGMKSDLFGYSVMVWGYIVHAAMVLLPFFFSMTGLYLSIFKICIDYFFVKPVFNKLNLRMKFSHFIAFEIYFIIYVLVLPFIVLPNREVKWKGRTF